MQRRILGLPRKRNPKPRATSQADDMIAMLIEEQNALEQSWSEHLAPIAEQLCAIPIAAHGLSDPPEQAISAALAAWRLGGEPCMRKLHQMAVEKCDEHSREVLSEHISMWWDGIGTWKAEPVLAR